MESIPLYPATGSRILPEPFPEHFTEQEISALLNAILKTIDIPFKKSENVPKTILADYFGTQKAGKTTVITEIERVFRRHGFNLFCPPETAEIESVRNKVSDDPMIMQAIHMTGVLDRLFSDSYHPRMHFVQDSRGPIDMLYWYERDRRKGIYNDDYCKVVEKFIYELLRKDLVDAFFFFTCSVEAAMRREYQHALTQKRGSKMNEKDVAETIDIYNKVLAGVNAHVPNLPIFHIDTSELDIREVSQEVLRFLLPVICRRFSVPLAEFLPHSPTLIHKNAKHAVNFEEQLKLRGVPVSDKVAQMGWIYQGQREQEDIYLEIDSLEGLSRIRKDDRGIRFFYKGPAGDRLLSHRSIDHFSMSAERADELCRKYPVSLKLVKTREHYRLEPPSYKEDGHFFTMHVDHIAELGDFTEIRALGSKCNTHTQELLDMAKNLGFGLSDIVEGSYYSLVKGRL